MINLLALISGIFLGISSGLGFKPCFKQPKNLRIQIVFSILGMFFLILFFINLNS